MPKRTDANQSEIVQALRDAFCLVTDLHTVGSGCPDLLVLDPSGYWWLVEVKSARGKLNQAEREWHGRHLRAGRLIVVRSAEDALRQMGLDKSFWQETLCTTPNGGCQDE